MIEGNTIRCDYSDCSVTDAWTVTDSPGGFQAGDIEEGTRKRAIAAGWRIISDGKALCPAHQINP